MVPTPLRNPTEPHGVLHELFDVVVILKGLNGLAEIASGTALFLLQPGTIIVWVSWLTQSELIEDPNDVLSTLLHRWAVGFSHDSQLFAGFYLLSHGVVKVLLASLLYIEQKIWAFPLALALFSLLVTFSLYRLAFHWSWFLVGFIVFDLLVIWLIAREWRAIEKIRGAI